MLAAAALGIAACGDSSDSASTTTESAAPAVATPTATTPTPSTDARRSEPQGEPFDHGSRPKLQANDHERTDIPISGMIVAAYRLGA